MPSREIFNMDCSNGPFFEGFKKNTVTFTNIKSTYSGTELISIRVSLPAKLRAKDTDMVGLFPLGWSSLRQSLTFEWVSEGKRNNGGLNDIILQFAPQFHSHAIEDNKYYQFVYVCRQIEVLGVSSPFRFIVSLTSPPTSEPFEESAVLLKSSSARSHVNMDISLVPVGDGQTAIRLALDRNRFLEDRVSHLEKELDRSKCQLQKSEDLVKFVSKRKKWSQSFIQNLMADLDEKGTVTVVHGRTEMTIQKISKRERPKPENQCSKIVYLANTPHLSSSRLEAAPSLMKDLCLNLKRSLRVIGVPLGKQGSNSTTGHNAVDSGKKPVVKYYEKKNFKTTEPIAPENRCATREQSMLQKEAAVCVTNSETQKRQEEEGYSFRECLLTKSHSFFPSVSFLEQKVVDVKQVLDVIVNHLNQTRNKWNLLWKDSTAGNGTDEEDAAEKTQEKKVKIKLIIPMTQNDISEMIGSHKGTGSIIASGNKSKMAEVEQRSDYKWQKVVKKLDTEGIKLTGRILEID